MKVLISDDCDDGLRQALQEHPDLIVLDIIMPRMDGITMLPELRKDVWGKTAKVLLLTNLTNKEKEADVAELDVLGYLIKSNCSLGSLLEKIQRYL